MEPQVMNLAAVSNAINGINPHASRLQQLVQTRLTDDRLGKVVDKLMTKAEGGDAKALDYLLTLGGFRSQTPATVVVNQFVDHHDAPKHVVLNGESSPARTIATYLSVSGAALPSVIAEQVKMPEHEVIRVLDDYPQRFGIDGAKYFLIGQKKH